MLVGGYAGYAIGTCIGTFGPTGIGNSYAFKST